MQSTESHTSHTLHTKYYQTLISCESAIGDRYAAVFQLKDICTQESIRLLMDAYKECGSSILLKHELLYALGQLPKKYYPEIKEFLFKKVQDESENSLSRHEAAEALGNYFDHQVIELYLKYKNSECKELRDTCEVAIQKIKNKNMENMYGLDYNGTKQPAAPYSQAQFEQVVAKHNLENSANPYLDLLVMEALPLFQKYRIMYYMRNRKQKKCIQTLCSLLSLKYYKTQCALLKHEICFILGQIGYDEYESMVRECIENEDEEDIVRHEALAAVASQGKDINYLNQFTQPNKYPQLLRQSAQVAIYSIKYWNQ